VGTQRYAVDLRRVDEVLTPSEVMPLKDAQAPVVGCVRVRGETLPVVELRAALGEGPAGESARPGLLVCRLGRRRVGFRIDGVGAVARVGAGTLGVPDGTVSPAVVAVWAQPPDVHFLVDLKALLRGQSPPLSAPG
jgi:chemotaxis signal transduction protein